MSVTINSTNFPDEVFRAYISYEFDRDHDGTLSDAEIANAKEIDITTTYVTTLLEKDPLNFRSTQGIEFLTALEKLKIFDFSNLSSVDVSSNTNLYHFAVEACNLATLDVRNNSGLKKLYCDRNPLSQIQLGTHLELEELNASGGLVNNVLVHPTYTSIDLSTCNNLKELIVCDSNISSLNLSSARQLEKIDISRTNITQLNIASNPNIVRFLSANTSLAEIDITKSSTLVYWYQKATPYSYTYDNVENIQYASSDGHEGITVKASTNIVVTGVAINETNFPDAVFRQYVSDTYDTNHDDILSNAEIAAAVNLILIGNTNSSFWPGESVTGIKYLTALKKIRIKTDKLTSFNASIFSALEELDLSGSTSIVELNQDARKLKKINCHGCTSLKKIQTWGFLYSYDLEEVDFGDCINLEGDLHIGSKKYLTKLCASGCTKITGIQAGRSGSKYEYSDGLTEIDISGCRNLLYVGLSYNSIERFIFDSESYERLNSIGLTSNNLNTLSLPIAPKLDRLTCALNNIRILDVEQYPILVRAVQSGNVRFYRDYDWDPDAEEQQYYDQKIYTLEHTSTSSDGTITVTVRNHITCDPETIVYTTTSAMITSDPEDVTARVGDSVSFEIGAEGLDLTYQWLLYDSTNGIWSPIQGENSNILTITATAELDGTRYACRVSNGSSSVESAPATLTMFVAPTISSQPQNASVTEDDSAIFQVETTGILLSYQWQVSTDGITYTDIRYANESSYELVAALSMNGNKYRCVVTNDIGSATSDPATLTVTADPSLVPPTITTHPSSLEVAEGENATFSVTASGNNLSYQWQTLHNGVWYNINGATSSSHSVAASIALNRSQYRCQVSNSVGTIYSNIATLSVRVSGGGISTPTIKMQPRSVNVNVGQTAVFTVNADGGSLSYQWQVKREGQWYRIADGETNIYSIVARAIDDGTQYRCLVVNSAGSVYSNVVTLNVQAATPVSFYGYHSIIISGKNTYGEWEMYPTSRPHIAPPEVKTSYVDVPGADGGLDYTDLLTGEPRFGYRKGSWEFLLIPQERWADVYRSLCNYLNGRVHTVVLEDDPTWQYTGRLSVNKWESAAHNSLITIDYILDPNPVNLEDESYNTDDDDLAASARILRKPGNEGMVIGMFNGSATVVDPMIYFEDGDNISY